jgi:hypothetical protein
MDERPGRDTTKGDRPAKARRRSGWWLFALAAVFFAVNYWVGSRATQMPTRVRVPYSPFFL